MADTPKLRLTLYVLTTPNLVVRRRVCMSRGTLNWGALGCGACLIPKKRPPPRVKNPSAFFVLGQKVKVIGTTRIDRVPVTFC